MALTEKYHLAFYKKGISGRLEFECQVKLDSTFQDSKIAYKINQMSDYECKSLLDEVNLALQGKDFDPYFSIDREYASDEDGLEIAPPNIIIDNTTYIPLMDIKSLLEEWLNFIQISRKVSKA